MDFAGGVGTREGFDFHAAGFFQPPDPRVESRRLIHRVSELPCLVATSGDRWLGLAAYRLAAGACELVLLEAFERGRGTGTALLDAVYMAVHEMKKARNPRKALLLISDGGDNSSRYSEAEIKSVVKEADVQIYAIGIYESAGARNRTPEETTGPALLTEIAEQTGGRQYQVDDLNELPDVAAKIGVELRNQYILGYSPRNLSRDGKYRRVQVRLVQPHGMPLLRPFWKQGYYAPAQ